MYNICHRPPIISIYIYIYIQITRSCMLCKFIFLSISNRSTLVHLNTIKCFGEKLNIFGGSPSGYVPGTARRQRVSAKRNDGKKYRRKTITSDSKSDWPRRANVSVTENEKQNPARFGGLCAC